MNARIVWVLAVGLLGCGSSSMGDGGSGCQAGVTPANLVDNFGFECGGAAPTEWSAVFGTLEFPTGDAHEGQRAAKLTATSAGARFAYAPEILTGGTQTYCATVWAKGTAPFMRLRVLRDDGGGQFRSFEFNSPVPKMWERVPPSITLKIPNENARALQVVLELQTNRSDGMNAMPGDVLQIDAVDVWASPSRACDER